MISKLMISSTVSEFRDIRRALKELLLEAGYRVWISEDGSIQTDSDKSAFENCFEAVRSADFCVFILGGKYGTLFDVDRNISVTRQEYRVACEEKKPHLVFVERGVWEAKAVHGAYSDHGHAFIESPQIEDSRVIDFLDEVTGKTEGNWIHIFNDISDLLSRVKAQLGIINPDYEFYWQATKGNLKNEDGTLNYEIGFKNISGKPLLEFELFINFSNPVLSIDYDFPRSQVNLTGGRNLSSDKESFHWSG